MTAIKRIVPFALTFAVLMLAMPAGAQNAGKPADPPSAAAAKLTVGDKAPALQVEKFLKGEPVKEFKAGRIYVVEFWATWCGPCKASMPHLTDLQKKFQEKVTFIGVNIREDKQGYTEKTLGKVEDFVKNNGEKLGYTIAFDGAARAADKAYMDAAGQMGIPTAFIITPDAKIAFIGHPMDPGFDGTIEKLVAGKFDMKEAIAAYKEQQAADAAEDDVRKFVKLLNAKDYDQAYALAAKLLEGPAAKDPQFMNEIAWSIVDPEAKIEKPNLDLAFKAAELAVKLTDGKDASILDTLARCHWVKGDKAKAIELQTKAVDLCKDDPETKASLQKTLDQYKK
jgi:thiol-disulfide isomerase/thioredoxin